MDYELELPDGFYSVSDFQYYIGYIIKKHETLTKIPRFCVYINRNNIKLVFKLKDGYELELQTPETMKLFGWTRKLIDKTKNGENAPSLEAVQIVLVQFKSVVNQYKQKSEVLLTFISKFVYLLIVVPSNLVFLKIYNAHFDEIIIKFTDQNARLLEIEDKVNLTLLINKQKWGNILCNLKPENVLKYMDYRK